eukprot:7327511-Pyramimonas_sp.AAC.2
MVGWVAMLVVSTSARGSMASAAGTERVGHDREVTRLWRRVLPDRNVCLVVPSARAAASSDGVPAKVTKPKPLLGTDETGGAVAAHGK